MAKKSFKDAVTGDANPATAFLTQAEEPKLKNDTKEDDQPTVRRGDWKHRASHEKGTETYSKRVQLLMRPSTQQAVKSLADAQGKSVNNFINDILESYIDRQ